MRKPDLAVSEKEFQALRLFLNDGEIPKGGALPEVIWRDRGLREIVHAYVRRENEKRGHNARIKANAERQAKLKAEREQQARLQTAEKLINKRAQAEARAREEERLIAEYDQHMKDTAA
jgi:uncharacterized membrane-anchored protein